MTPTWDWAAAARSAGATADGRFNLGALTPPRAGGLIWHRANGTTHVLGGGDLRELAGQQAAALRRVGVSPGDRVAVMLGRRPESFTLALAVWRLGALLVPLFSGFGVDAVGARLDDSGATAMIVDAPNAEVGRRACEDRPSTRLVGLEPPRADDVDIDLTAMLAQPHPEAGIHETRLDDPCTIMYTSGTSGPPKGCVIPHRGVVSLIPYVCHCLALAPGETLFSTADPGWSFGLFTTGLAPMLLGHTRLLHEGGFDARKWWATMRRQRVTHLASAPTGFRQLAAAGTEAFDGKAPPVRAATSAGEPLTGEVVGWFEEHLGFTVLDSYGLTELGMVIANQRGPAAPAPVAGTMGHPLPGFEVELLDADDRPVGDGEAGRIVVRDNGWALGSGYWEREELWADRVHDGLWYTEDIAVRDDRGCFRYVGRADDVIVTAGYNVGPSDVESALLQHHSIVDAACVGEPDPRKGQVVAAHVVISSGLQDGGGNDELLAELRAWVGARIGWHAAPRRLHIHESLPRTESGKVIRRALKG